MGAEQRNRPGFRICPPLKRRQPTLTAAPRAVAARGGLRPLARRLRSRRVSGRGCETRRCESALSLAGSSTDDAAGQAPTPSPPRPRAAARCRARFGASDPRLLDATSRTEHQAAPPSSSRQLSPRPQTDACARQRASPPEHNRRARARGRPPLARSDGVDSRRCTSGLKDKQQPAMAARRCRRPLLRCAPRRRRARRDRASPDCSYRHARAPRLPRATSQACCPLLAAIDCGGDDVGDGRFVADAERLASASGQEMLRPRRRQVTATTERRSCYTVRAQAATLVNDRPPDARRSQSYAAGLPRDGTVLRAPPRLDRVAARRVPRRVDSKYTVGRLERRARTALVILVGGCAGFASDHAQAGRQRRRLREDASRAMSALPRLALSVSRVQ